MSLPACIVLVNLFRQYRNDYLLVIDLHRRRHMFFPILYLMLNGLMYY